LSCTGVVLASARSRARATRSPRSCRC
jgi:hypothetical protein